MTSDSYYGQPVIKPPVWTWEVPAYFFTGGVAGVSSLVALGAKVAGDEDLARRAAALGAGAAATSPALLISDLGRPARFHHMLRVFRPTSPMNVGSWILSAYVPAALGTWLLGRRVPGRALQPAARSVAAALGAPMATYTSVLVADTAVPVWHDARRELPFVFAGGSLAGAGSLLTLMSGGGSTATRLLGAAGAGLELAASRRMEARLGQLAEPYRSGRTGKITRGAKVASGMGLGLSVLGGKRRPTGLVGAALILIGAILDRWAVFRAGSDSAQDPRYTVEPQRRRLRRPATESEATTRPPQPAPSH